MLSLLLAVTLTLPICEVKELPDRQSKTYPAVVTPIARVDVVPQVDAEILEVCFENGAHVKKGDVLYRLDPVKYEAEVKEAEAKIADCKANLDYAERSYRRHKNLIESRAVSLDAVENALSERDRARAALASAEAGLVLARENRRRCTITAPISGEVGTTCKTAGNFVMTNPNTWPLVDLVQTDPIRVRFSISNRDYLRMFGGQIDTMRARGRVQVVLADGKTYAREGKIEYAENSANRRTDTTHIYVLLDNPEGMLIPDGTVSVTLSSVKGTPRLAVPVTAVLQDERGPYVWVVDAQGQVEHRPIARGRISEGWQFVEKGLSLGERLVAEGPHKVRPGMTIKPASEK